MTLSELVLHLSREELEALGVWPGPMNDEMSEQGTEGFSCAPDAQVAFTS
jgi:hypothetical protein